MCIHQTVGGRLVARLNFALSLAPMLASCDAATTDRLIAVAAHLGLRGEA